MTAEQRPAALTNAFVGALRLRRPRDHSNGAQAPQEKARPGIGGEDAGPGTPPVQPGGWSEAEAPADMIGIAPSVARIRTYG